MNADSHNKIEDIPTQPDGDTLSKFKEALKKFHNCEITKEELLDATPLERKDPKKVWVDYYESPSRQAAEKEWREKHGR